LSKKTLTFAVCGYGGAFNMGRRHAQELHDTGRAQLTAVCDPDPARRRAAEADFPGIETYASLKRLLARSPAQLIVIITPHNSHAPLALQALRARRHAIVEKPMCLTYTEARAMMRAARAGRRMLSVYHNRRWDPDYVTVKALVDRGAVGDVFNVRCHMQSYGLKTDWWRARRHISGGCLYDWGAHMVDWTLGLVGAKVRSVVGFSQKRVWTEASIEDEARVLIRFADGVVGDIMVSHIRNVPARPKWEVMGTRGSIVSYWRSDHLELTTRRRGRTVVEHVPFARPDPKAYYRNVVQHVLDRNPLRVTAESAARVIAVIESQARSARTGRTVRVPGE